MKRILSFLLTLCLIVGLLPAVAVPTFAAATSATVTLWGTAVTATTETAYYWTNNGTSAPAESTADAEWNYSFAIIDGVPTVTIRNADFQYSARFLYTTSSYSGSLHLVYEGTNTFKVPNASAKHFAYVQGVKANTVFSIVGKEGAQLNITGGYKDANLIQVATSNSNFYIRGGEINITRTVAGKYGVIGCTYADAVIEDCTLNVTNNYANAYICMPAVTLGGGGYDCTIRNSNVTINAENIIGLCVGIPATTSTVSATNNLTIEGDSNVVINEYRNDDAASKTYTGGIYAAKVIVKGGNLEVSGRDNAFTITNTSANGPDLSQYDGEYQMYTAVDGEAVTEYTQTAYFKLAKVVPCPHENTTTTEETTLEATCGEEGSKTITVTCADCGEVTSESTVALPATNEHTYDEVTGVCSGCGDVEIPVEGPTWPEDMTFATAEQMANVVLEKKASAGGAVTAHPGGKITYKLSITNNNAEAINVHVEDLIPKDTKLLSGCDYTSGRALYWVVEDIAPGETRVITYNVKPDYTIAEVRASAFDIILTNTDAKVMDVTVPAPAKDIYVLETFNAEDIRKMEMAIDALVTANLTAKNSSKNPLNRISLASMMYNVGFTVSTGLGTTDPDEIFTLVFDKAGETGSGSSSGGVEDVVDTATNLVKRVAPTLYGGTAISADKDELFRGERATEVTINDLISGDLIFVNKNGETKLYIVDGAKLVYLGETEVVRAIDPATVLPGLTTSDKYVVIRPSINLNITFSLQEGEYFNAADAEGYTDVEKAIIATAETYLLRGDRTQYTDDMTGTSLNRAEAGYKQPEDYTVDQYGYTNCAFFTYDVHVMTHGYKPYGNSTNLNTTANNAAYAKKYWDFETGTSSSKGVIYYAEPMQKDGSGTYVSTLTDEEKAAMKEQIISLMRPGDIINIRRTTGSGHAMLYVGNGTIIHSSGSNYSSTNKTDTHEASIRFRMVEDLFDPAIYNETSCVYNLASFALIRPQNLTSNGVTENAANRINNMQGIIGEKISSTAMGKTVNCGDEITYTFYVFNTNAEERTININDVLSEYVTFVSATNGGTCVGGNVSWNFTVPADTRMSVSYTVKVNDGLTHYTAIDGSKATINGVSHKCIDTYVANTLSAEQQQILVEAVNKVKEMDVSGLNGVEIANLIYKEAFGIEKLFGEKITNMAELVNGDTDNSSSTKGVDNIGIFNDTWYWESSNKTSVSWMPNYNTSVAAQMVAPGMYGGQLVYQSSYNKNNRDERQNRYLNVGDSTLRSRYFWEKDLVVGDLFVMATLSSQRSLYIYVGDDTFVSIGEGFTVFTEQSVSARFQYAPASTWKFLAVLRPSFAFEEAHNVVEIPAVESSCTAAGTTAGKECADCGVHLVEPLTVAALGHTEKTAVETAEATCTSAGAVKTTVTCEVCGETISETTEEIAALGHTYGNDFDTTCDVCGDVREVAESLTVTEDNKLLLVDTDETHINHRVVVYYLGDRTVADITDEAALKAIDPDAATYWKASKINAKVLSKSGNYVLAYNYNDTEQNGKKVTVYIEASVVAPEVIAPTIEVDGYKVIMTAGDDICVNYRATVYYLGTQTVEDINDATALASIDSTAKTYWGLNDINKIHLLKSGNYVIHLDYNAIAGVKQTVAKAVTVDLSEVTLDMVDGKLIAADPNNAYIYHRAVVYYLGDATVADIEDEVAVSAAATSATTYWGLNRINTAKLAQSGNYVVMLQYNLPGSPKMTVAVAVAR